MNSKTIMFTDTEGEEEEVFSRSVNFLQEREHPVYDEYKFWKTFQMSRTLFNRIVQEVTNHSSFFHDDIDCIEKEVDGIYPEFVTFVKTIPEPYDDDHKRIRYNQMQEAGKKDVKRVFCVLKKKWTILANPARPLKKERIMSMMYTCIILHNMIRKDKEKVISPNWYSGEAHQPEDLERSDEQVRVVMRHIKLAQAHQNLRADLVEHLSCNA
nr:hypothetical protein [Tanacetum cinerariifolium]